MSEKKLYVGAYNEKKKKMEIYYVDDTGNADLFFSPTVGLNFHDYIITNKYIYYTANEGHGDPVYLYRYDRDTKQYVIMNEAKHGMIQFANGYFLITSWAEYEVFDMDGNKVDIQL